MKNKNLIIILISLLIIVLYLIFVNKKDNKEKIIIWAYDNAATVAEKAVEIYKKDNNIDIDFEVVKIGQEDMVEKLKIYLSTNSLKNLPDVFFDEDYNFLEFIKYYGKNFADLTDYVNLEDFAEFKRINVVHEGRTYAIPYDSGVGVLFYRKDLIEKAGFKEQDMDNLTWDRYIEIGKQVKEKTGIDMLTIVPEGDMEGTLMYQSAGTWFFDSEGKANIKGKKISV